MNEILLIISVLITFGATLLAYRFFGKTGLYCMSVVTTIMANIEVVILVNAFGMEQTLGNVLFAASFLITDIFSECEGKKDANKAVILGVFCNAFFLIVSQMWQFYTPSQNDLFLDSVKNVFSSTPRVILASLSVYAISQFFDVWLYHKWWALTEKKSQNSRKFLWVRNNGSTLISQLVNATLFTIFAFAGTYDIKTLISIFASSYIIYIATSLLDTPAVYLARRIKEKSDKKLQSI